MTKSKNITKSPALVSPEMRHQKLGQKGVVLWFTGMSASGKSTVARLVENHLVMSGKNAYVLDGDNIRFGLNKDLGFSPEDRKENVRRISEITKLFYEASIITIAAFISPYRSDRDLARSLVPEGSFIEIFCDTSLEECEKRDPKGLYKKARAGLIADFTGVSAPYEVPLKPELVIKTGEETPEASVAKVMSLLQARGVCA